MAFRVLITDRLHATVEHFTYSIIYCTLCIVLYILHINYVCAYIGTIWEHDKLFGKGLLAGHCSFAKKNDFLSDVDVELRTVGKRRK